MKKSEMKFLFLIPVLTTLCLISAAAELAPLRVKDGKVMAGDREIRLRGINWGWWHDSGTRYTEEEMKRQAEWGANVLRLTIRYTDVANADGSWNEERAAAVDEVVAWAGKHGQYVIIDMHEVPGGQTPTHYCVGGKNEFWKEAKFQEQFIELWKKLAERYRNTPAVGAYELMNEPCTVPPDPKLTAELQRRAIEAIRAIDPDKMIVVTGDNWSNFQSSLSDVVLQKDPNILYTIHFYTGGWLHNVGEDKGVSGTRDWFFFELPVPVPADTYSPELSIILRSTNNEGTAWFDDVVMTDDRGKVIHSFGFDEGIERFSIERSPFGVLEYDAAVGHTRPGSLRISGTNSYNSWMSPRLKIEPGKTYKLSGWIKLEKGTGSTYIGASLFNLCRPALEQLRDALKPVAAFAKKYNVPIFVGEFSITRDSGPEGYQATAIADRIRVMEEQNFHWTYWNYRETTGPGTMALHAQKKDGSDYPINEPLLKVLKEGWKRNAEPLR